MYYETIIIANIAEAFEDILTRVTPWEKRTKKIQIEHNLCDRALLWEGDNKILITPFAISPLLFENNIKVLGFKNCLNLFPKNIDINLSNAITEDRPLMEKLVSIIKNNPGIRISPYAVTQSFIDLTEVFKSENLNFIIEERPRKNSDWIVQFLDSKVGSRKEIDKIRNKNINTPQSIICRSRKEVINVVERFYKNNLSCVIKANYGEGGWGTLIIKKDDYKSWTAVLVQINKELNKDAIWDNGLMMVEEYIIAERGISSGCPSAELFLSDRGVKITYLCDQVVTETGNFLGVAIGKDALNQRAKVNIKKASLLVGEKFWELNYRGFFDIDFVLSKNSEMLYIIETNMRRTGGTHVFDVAKLIFGDQWENKVFIFSQDSFSYKGKLLSEKVILKKMKNILFPINKEKRGLIISVINKWKPAFGFMIIEKSSDKALKIYSEMENLFYIKS